MKPGTRRYTVETIRAGQPRPYADSIYEYILHIEWIPSYGPNKTDWQPCNTADSLVLELAKVLCRPFKCKGETPPPNWSDPILQTFEKQANGRWRFVITAEYTG